MNKAYKYRIYPTALQTAMFMRTFLRRRYATVVETDRNLSSLTGFINVAVVWSLTEIIMLL